MISSLARFQALHEYFFVFMSVDLANRRLRVVVNRKRSKRAKVKTVARKFASESVTDERRYCIMSDRI